MTRLLLATVVLALASCSLKTAPSPKPVPQTTDAEYKLMIENCAAMMDAQYPRSSSTRTDWRRACHSQMHAAFGR